MAIISYLKKSDVNILKDLSIEMGCSFAYLEKDYYIVQLIQCLQNLSLDGHRLVFTGGTALAKAYRSIERFSEDCDFILIGENLNRSKLSKIRAIIDNHIRNYGFEVLEVKPKNNNRNIEFSIKYEKIAEVGVALRNELKLEIIYKDIHPKTTQQNVQSFLSQAKHETCDIKSVECLSISDIATGKISALIWRYLDTSKQPDNTLIRHLYDLTAISHSLMESIEFKKNAGMVIKRDLDDRLKEPDLCPREAGNRLISLLESNPKYKQDYDYYLGSFLFTSKIDSKITFEDCLISIKEILDFID